jgi:hypothetical protein
MRTLLNYNRDLRDKEDPQLRDRENFKRKFKFPMATTKTTQR